MVRSAPPGEGHPVDLLRERIQRLHLHNGKPSTREIARRIGNKVISHTTVNSVLHCVKCPRWGSLELIVEALGGVAEEFRPLWIAAQEDPEQAQMADCGTYNACQSEILEENISDILFRGNYSWITQNESTPSSRYRSIFAASDVPGDRLAIPPTPRGSGMTAQSRALRNEAESLYRRSLSISEELAASPSGMPAQASYFVNARDYSRARREEAEFWCRKSLDISEELGDHLGMALRYAALGLLAEENDQHALAMAWNIRGAALFDVFPSPLADSGPIALIRLSRRLGIAALEETWTQATGKALPQEARDYITRHVPPVGFSRP